MKILSINTSTPSGSVALTREGCIVEEMNLNIERTHSETILPVIDRVLRDGGVGLEEVDGIAVTAGPGSFTGLRVGISIAKGLAWALGKPVVGVSTLHALALNLPFSEGPICPVLDARKGEVYAALFRRDGNGLKRVMDDRVMKPETLIGSLPEEEEIIFLGEGLSLWRERIEEGLKGRAIFAPPYLWVVRASCVGFLALDHLLRGEAEDPKELLPIYLRPSEAELKARGDLP